MVNATEMARHHSLTRRGIGFSHEAVMVQRGRERDLRTAQIDKGERLPGWLAMGLGTEKELAGAIEKLTPEARRIYLQALQKKTPTF